MLTVDSCTVLSIEEVFTLATLPALDSFNAQTDFFYCSFQIF